MSSVCVCEKYTRMCACATSRLSIVNQFSDGGMYIYISGTQTPDDDQDDAIGIYYTRII